MKDNELSLLNKIVDQSESFTNIKIQRKIPTKKKVIKRKLPNTSHVLQEVQKCNNINDAYDTILDILKNPIRHENKINSLNSSRVNPM